MALISAGEISNEQTTEVCKDSCCRSVNIVLALNNIHPSSIFTYTRFQIHTNITLIDYWYCTYDVQNTSKTCLSHKHDCMTRIPISLHDKVWYKMIQTWYTYDRHIIYWSHLFINKKHKNISSCNRTKPHASKHWEPGVCTKKERCLPRFCEPESAEVSQRKWDNGNDPSRGFKKLDTDTDENSRAYWKCGDFNE